MAFLHTGRAALWRCRFPRVPFSPIRCLNSGDSDDDFKPKRKNIPDLTDVRDVHALIDDHVKSHPVMLYMKGTPTAPQCGFSQQVVRLLDATGKYTAYLQVCFQPSLKSIYSHTEYRTGCEFSSVNVLDYPEIREGIKSFSYVHYCYHLKI